MTREAYGLLKKSFYKIILWASVLHAVLTLGCKREWRTVAFSADLNTLWINSLQFVDRNHGWAVGFGTLLETKDRGTTWIAHLEIKGHFHTVHFLNKNTGWLFGASIDEPAVEELDNPLALDPRTESDPHIRALILHTEDGGGTWRHKEIPIIYGGLKDGCFGNPQVGWAVGKNTVISTTNGGRSWNTQHQLGANETITRIRCYSNEHAWVVGLGGLVLETTDGGSNWTRHNVESGASFSQIHFVGERGWLLGGTPGTLLMTDDGGKTWDPANVHDVLFLTDLAILGNEGWIVGSDGAILHSTDAGLT